MKQLITTAVLLFSTTAFAQVGINNTSPKATLDITAKTNGTKPEGLIIPQLSGSDIRTATAASVYGTAQKGLILYASAADSAPAGATASITAPGYYYFDGSAWQKIATGNTLNTSLANGNILVGNASNVATAVIPTGDVAISNAGITSIGAGKVTNTHMASAAALTVKGNATNAAASPTDIAAGTDGYVLRRSGTTLGFGTVATAGIADGAVTTAKIAADAITSTQIATGAVSNADLASAAALTVKGNATNAVAAPTDIAAGTDGYILRRSGTALGFGTVDTAGITDGAVTAAKLNQMSATSGQVLGWNGSIWTPTNSDTTNDAWINDTTNGMIKLGTKADGTARAVGTDFVAKDNGQIGIGTSSPGSKLQVEGSLGLNYTSISSTTYTIAANDYYVNYTGSNDAVFTLPSGTSSTCNCKGRAYEIVNNSNYSITVNASASETINGNSSFVITAKTVAKIANTNVASGNTWSNVYYSPIEFSANQGSITTKTLYNSSSSDLTKTVRIGRFEIRVNSSLPEFRLVNPPSSNVTIYRNVEQNWENNGYSSNTYNNIFTTTNWNTYQSLADYISFTEKNTYWLAYPGDSTLLKVEILAMGNGTASTTWAIICTQY